MRNLKNCLEACRAENIELLNDTNLLLQENDQLLKELSACTEENDRLKLQNNKLMKLLEDSQCDLEEVQLKLHDQKQNDTYKPFVTKLSKRSNNLDVTLSQDPSMDRLYYKSCSISREGWDKLDYQLAFESLQAEIIRKTRIQTEYISRVEDQVRIYKNEAEELTELVRKSESNNKLIQLNYKTLDEIV